MGNCRRSPWRRERLESKQNGVISMDYGFDERIVVARGDRGAQTARLVRVEPDKGRALYRAEDETLWWLFAEPSGRMMGGA